MRTEEGGIKIENSCHAPHGFRFALSLSLRLFFFLLQNFASTKFPFFSSTFFFAYALVAFSLEKEAEVAKKRGKREKGKARGKLRRRESIKSKGGGKEGKGGGRGARS